MVSIQSKEADIISTNQLTRQQYSLFTCTFALYYSVWLPLQSFTDFFFSNPHFALFCLSISGGTDSVCMCLPPPPPIQIPLFVSLCAVRPRLWQKRRRVMFGLSVWLLVSVSGAAGSSDSAGGAAGPSRVQPSPCDTLSVTDPLRLVTWHPPSQWPFHCHSAVSHSVSHLLPHWGVFSRS